MPAQGKQERTKQTVLDFPFQPSSPLITSCDSVTDLSQGFFCTVWVELAVKPKYITMVSLTKATRTFGWHEVCFIYKISEMQFNAHVISECKSYSFLQIFSSDSNSRFSFFKQ